MAKAVVIVESPAKAKTIERYLGNNFRVLACAGHIKDLPASRLGVDVDHDFQPAYQVISGKERILKQLKKEIRSQTDIYLATDPDREGEAICQHLAEELNGSQNRKIYRVLFNEVTKKAILKAIKNPLPINQNKVEAQQARRILDRLVGYKISPLLWQKVRRGLSAGRVQTVALRMIVEREKEIKSFVAEEYWNFTARLKGKNSPVFDAKAVRHKGKKFKIPDKTEADKLAKELSQVDFLVASVKKKAKKRSPTPPFITSNLQQDGSRKLGFSVKKTMVLAQRLYEGIEISPGYSVGLITYMRTDSTRVAGTSLDEVRDYIKREYGDEYLPAKAIIYRGKKGIQDAHEAIRPTSVLRNPSTVKSCLGRDEYRLYEMIWNRFVTSQMNPAIFDQTEIQIQAGPVEFRVVGEVMKFEGFLRIRRETREGSSELKKNVLPKLTKGEKLEVEKILPEQKFKQPPSRYGEAGLVKALEEKGIGRPSTYAQILSVIMDREYVSKSERRFVPTEIGEVVCGLLVNHFGAIFDYDYTAKLEQDLDEIEHGKERWVKMLQGFYSEFYKELKQARTEMKNLRSEKISSGIKCEKCGDELLIRWGRFGKFLACENYPTCKNTRQLLQEPAEDASSEGSEVEICQSCSKPMVLRKGRYGEFLACSGYPNCKNTMKIVSGNQKPLKDILLSQKCPKCSAQLVKKHGRYGQFTACSNYPDCKYIQQETTDVNCPRCETGELVRRRSRRGRSFYGCNKYPDCDFVLWKKPVKRDCPLCKATFVVEYKSKNEGMIYSCHSSECSYKEVVE